MADPRDIYLDPGFSDRTAYGPSLPREQAQPRSFLDMLRERAAREMENENMTRLREFGAGMLASGSPNFFTNLAAGTRAQAEGERSRMDRLRQLAETERQQRALDLEERRRQEELRLREEELRLNAPYRAAQTDQARALAEYYRQGGRGSGGRDPTPAALRTATQAGNEALQAAIRQAAAAIPQRTLSPEEQDTIWRAAYNRSIQGQGVQAPAGMSTPNVTAPPAPAARIDARGNPIR